MAKEEQLKKKLKKEEKKREKANAKALEKKKKEEAKALKRQKAEAKRKKLSKYETKKTNFFLQKAELSGAFFIQMLDIFNEKVDTVISGLGRLIESGAANFIVILDYVIDLSVWYVVRTFIFFLRHVFDFREYLNRTRKKFIKSIIEIGIVAAILTVTYGSVIDYEYAYNGRVLGIVNDQTQVVDILDLISDELSQEYEAAIKINAERDITFKPVLSMNQDIDKADDVLKKFSYLGEIYVDAYGIFANGSQVAALDTEEDANSVLQMIKNKYITNEGEYEEVTFLEDVEIKEVQVSLAKLFNKETAVEYITGAISQINHVVEDGDTVDDICAFYGISFDEFMEMNPEYDSNVGMRVGDVFRILTNKPLLTLETVRVAQFAQAIPFDTEYVDSSSYYLDTYIISQEGVEGRKSVTARVKEVNGQVMAEEILAEEVLVEPTNRIVAHGTKPIPPREGTGTFIAPVSGYQIGSRYGYRVNPVNGVWGLHYGIDLQASHGTYIHAADGGVVVQAGWNGGHGYSVTIDHGGLYRTLYAHCSTVLVSEGDLVYQDQVIARVGSTGNSTGPHCHFEIQYDGTAVDPENYISF